MQPVILLSFTRSKADTKQFLRTARQPAAAMCGHEAYTRADLKLYSLYPQKALR